MSMCWLPLAWRTLTWFSSEFDGLTDYKILLL
jgi:hypothetical protein